VPLSGWTYGGSGQCVEVPYLGKDQLPNGVRSYPAREVDGLIFVFRRFGLAQSRLPTALGASQRKDYKTGGSIVKWLATTPSCTRICST